jgi:hypothetical protein
MRVSPPPLIISKGYMEEWLNMKKKERKISCRDGNEVESGTQHSVTLRPSGPFLRLQGHGAEHKWWPCNYIIKCK